MKILSLLLMWLTCFSAGEAEKTFYRAFYLESALRDMETAAETYAQAEAEAREASNADLEARSVLGRARCLRALGRLDESRELFARVLELDPENPEAQAALEEKSPGDGIDPALALRIQALVQELGGDGRENAKADLSRIGALAIPFLAEGLRSRDVAVVENAAELLAKVGSGPAADALRLGLRDPEVLFPRLIGEVLSWVAWNPSTQALFEAAMVHGDAKIREDGIVYAAQKGRQVPVDQRTAIARRALLDPSPAVRERAFEFEDVWDALTAELLGALEDESVDVRERAAWAFALLHPDTIDGALLQRAGLLALGDEDGKVIQAGERILANSRTPWSEPVQKAVGARLRQQLLAVTPSGRPIHPTDALYGLIGPSGGPGLSEDDLRELYVLAGPSSHAGELILMRMQKLLGSESARLWNFMTETLRATSDEPGQRMLLKQNRRSFSSPVQPGPLSLLLAGAESDFSSVRQEAYKHLRKELDAARVAALPHLLSDLSNEDHNLSVAAFKLIERFPRPEVAEAALAFFQRLLAQGDENAAALDFYVECAGASATPIVRELLRTGGGKLFSSLVHHLTRLDGEQAVPDLLALDLRGKQLFIVAGVVPDPKVLARYVLALPAEAVRDDLLRSVEGRIPEAALEQLLLRALDSADSATQAEACHLAGLAAFESMLPKLTALLESNTYLVRNAADAAVRAIQERKYRRLTANLLGKAGKSASLERALNLIKNEDPIKRQGGALALGALGDPAAIPALLDLLEDEDPAVRQSAVQALENLGRKPEGGGD